MWISSAAKSVLSAGVPRFVAMKLVGHRTEAIYRRYDITNEQDLRDGLAKVASMLWTPRCDSLA